MFRRSAATGGAWRGTYQHSVAPPAPAAWRRAAPGPAEPAPASRRGPARRPWRGVAAITLTLVVLRIPSIIEPTWYSDEGTYADIGRTLDHGAVLYRDVWDNKPPGIYWLNAAMSLHGASSQIVHGVLAVLVALATLLVWRVGRRLAGATAASVAGLTVAVLLSLPNLDGDLLNAETAGAVLSLGAVALMLAGRPRPAMRRMLAGALVAMAMLFKAVFVADLAAVVTLPAVLTVAGGARIGRPEVRAAGQVLAGCLGLLALVAIPLAAGGSMPGLVDVLLHQDVDYLRWSNGLIGARTDAGVAAAGQSSVLAVLAATRVALPLLGGAAVAALFARRRSVAGAVVSWWLAWDVAGVVLSSRGFTHYAQQAEAALALAVGLLAASAMRRWRVAGRPLAVAVALAAWPVVEMMLWLPGAEAAAASHQPLPDLQRHNMTAAQLPAYYANAWRRVTGRMSSAAYDASFPVNLARQHAVVDLLERTSAPGDRVFIWGSVHWSYALSDRVPAGRYVTLNAAYYVDPAAERQLLADLAGTPPAVVVIDTTPPPQLFAMLHRMRYRVVSHGVDGEDYWLAPRAGG